MSFLRSSNYNPSLILFGLEKELNNIIELQKIYKLPKVLMFSGEKGIGKFTLVFHFLAHYFDKENYDLKKLRIKDDTLFNRQFLNKIFPNITYVEGSNFKIEDIRDLKKKYFKNFYNK